MYSKQLIDMYMSAKNYTQKKQMAADIKMSQSYLSDIYNGRREFTDETGIWIAIECGLDPEETVLKLAASRAKTPEAKNVWSRALKRYCTGVEAAACAGLLGFAACFDTAFNFALCCNMLNGREIK